MNDSGSISVSYDQADPPVAVVELTGEHDSVTARPIRTELMRLADDGYAIVVDLRRSTFVDSSTLSELLAARREAEETDRGFAVVIDAEAAAQVHRIFSTTGLGSAFAIFGDPEAAVAAARAGDISPAAAPGAPQPR